MYISFCASFSCEPVFKGELYLKFVLFSIKVKYHVTSLGHGEGDLGNKVNRNKRRIRKRDGML